MVGMTEAIASSSRRKMMSAGVRALWTKRTSTSDARSNSVRVIDIKGMDLQPCGGTHVDNTSDIGAVVVSKIEKKSAMTRRVVLGLA